MTDPDVPRVQRRKRFSMFVMFCIWFGVVLVLGLIAISRHEGRPGWFW